MHIDTAALIRKCQEGDTEAYGQLVMCYSDYLFSIVFRLVNDEQYAEDLVQDAFVKAWQNIGKYNPSKSKFTTWLHTIGTRLSLDWMKKQKRWANMDELKVADKTWCKQETDDLVNKELGQMIQEACRLLSPQQKTIFVLRDLESMEVSEVIAITGYSEKKIKDNLYVARQKVRQQLEIYLKSEV